jgi:hypothetical protein
MSIFRSSDSSAGPAVNMPQPKKSNRDPRVDVMRGLALIMIFIDHIPNNVLALVTMRNFGFADAAEVFVLLAGFSAMMAYGKVFERDGTAKGLRRVLSRLGRIYLFQIGLLLITLGVVYAWTMHFNQQPTLVAPILNMPVNGIAHALALHAVPGYLNILPLYIVLFAAFPIIYAGLHRSVLLTLVVSAAIWLAVSWYGHFNLPNWIDGGTWFFNPFAWQFLFTIGAAFAIVERTHNGGLPHWNWLGWLCGLYLIGAFFEAAPWEMWGLSSLRPFAMPMPDKTHLSVLRLVDMLALAYLVLSSRSMVAVARLRLLRPVEACGKHSLEVFSTGCVVDLFGRLLFRTYGAGWEMQILVNLIGIGVMCWVGLYLEHRREAPVEKVPAATPPLIQEERA